LTSESGSVAERPVARSALLLSHAG
jgi:hypothetical protein